MSPRGGPEQPPAVPEPGGLHHGHPGRGDRPRARELEPPRPPRLPLLHCQVHGRVWLPGAVSRAASWNLLNIYSYNQEHL